MLFMPFGTIIVFLLQGTRVKSVSQAHSPNRREAINQLTNHHWLNLIDWPSASQERSEGTESSRKPEKSFHSRRYTPLSNTGEDRRGKKENRKTSHVTEKNKMKIQSSFLNAKESQQEQSAKSQMNKIRAKNKPRFESEKQQEEKKGENKNRIEIKSHHEVQRKESRSSGRGAKAERFIEHKGKTDHLSAEQRYRERKKGEWKIGSEGLLRVQDKYNRKREADSRAQKKCRDKKREQKKLKSSQQEN